MATSDQLLKAQRRAGSPQLNDYSRSGWVAVLRAMDIAQFGEPREIITWKWTKLDLYRKVRARLASGETFPSRKAIGNPHPELSEEERARMAGIDDEVMRVRGGHRSAR